MLDPGTIIDRYEIQQLLGEGGMSRVYRARHTILHSAHALKVLSAAMVSDVGIRERFLAEGRIQAQIVHPHIATVTDVLAHPGVAALVVEYVEGPTLDDWRRPLDRPPSRAEIEAILLPVLDAIQLAHDYGIVHRDLKPTNIVVAALRHRLFPVVLDFGIARVAQETRLTGAPTHATQAGVRMGTPSYMSPEQVQGLEEVDARTDIFALGAIAYELLSGAVAFEGEGDFETQRRIVAGELVPLRERMPAISAPLAEVVHRALANRPEDRFESCDDFAAALREALDREVLAAPSASPRAPGWGSAPPRPGLPLPSAPPAPPSPRPKPAQAARSAPFVALPTFAPIRMLAVPAGRHHMGSPIAEGGHPDERPVHEVMLAELWLSETPITQAQWLAVMNTRPSQLNGADLPVDSVSWFDAIEFCNTLSQLTGRRPVYQIHPSHEVDWNRGADGFRLPTEAEWEVACRAGNPGKWCSGNDPRAARAHAWTENNLRPVAQDAPNAWGFHDLHGQVEEWVWDWYGPYSDGLEKDPTGPVTGSMRVLRGGSAWSRLLATRSAHRTSHRPDRSTSSHGFRVATSRPSKEG